MTTDFLSYLKMALYDTSWRPFSWFMETVLYHPQWGYYARERSPFGYPQGDFCTAPVISPLFVQAVARQVFDLMAQLDSYCFCEIGPGSGLFCRTFLQYAQTRSIPLRHYYLVERAEARRREQEQQIADLPLAACVSWVESLPEAFEGVVFANELLDALPTEIVIWNETPLWRGVVWADGLHFSDRPLSDAPELYAQAMSLPPAMMPEQWPYCSEVSPAQSEMVSDILSAMARGWFLCVDYGFPRSVYYHPDRHMGTLMCHYQHQAHGHPLWHPGEQDVTVHVDFTACADAALSCGARIEGFLTQESFLINMGILDAVLALQSSSDSVTRVSVLRDFHLLTHPAEMGSLCHVMAFSKGCTVEAVGFSAGDRSHTL